MEILQRMTPEPPAEANIHPAVSSSLKRCLSSRLSVRGFLPLPPIMASPIDSPSSSISSESPAFHLPGDGPTPTSTAGVSVHVVVSTPTPTWTSTPPSPTTPPAIHLVRHSSACRLQCNSKAPTMPLSPLASFPASMHPHAKTRQTPGLKKCISVPDMLRRCRTISGPPRLGGYTPLPPNPPSFPITMGQANARTLASERTGKPTRSKTIFHLFNSPTDNEDDSAFYSAESRPRSANDSNSPEGSWSDHSPEDIWEEEKKKDALRKFHALKELLLTEFGYFADLKAFVTIYLRNLPALVTRTPTFNSTFGRASASFTTGPWVSSHAHLQSVALSSSATTDGSSATLSASSAKDAPRSNIRYLFTDNELELVARNAEDILQLHEGFIQELRELLESLGFPMQDDIEDTPTAEHLEVLESAVRAVSAKFATEASRFNAYQTFCAGHPEALDLVRKVSQQYPVEWEAFEQRCSAMAAEVTEGAKCHDSNPKHDPAVEAPHLALVTEDRTRALSLTSLDSAVRTLRLRCPSTRDSTQLLEIKQESTSHRIAFMDYLIKPVQRICKYPLLFDQVLSGNLQMEMASNGPDSRPHVDDIVKSAAQAMRHVASSVDEARHRQGAAIQMSLINSRMFLGVQTLGAVADSSVQGLTAEFLASLGTCLLAGSLDVMHHHPLQPLNSSSNFKARYFGAFLYAGGYLILVKVLKGRRYEPRHWFNLSEFTITGVEEEGMSLLPHSIRVSCCDQHFELAASCQREKDVWLAAIDSAVLAKPPWVNEPTPSFKLDDKGGLISSAHSEADLISGLPTILSIPELPNNNSDAELSEPFSPHIRGPASKPRNRLRRPENPSRSDVSPSTSRRSSTTSVKAIFGPLSDAESIVIRRSSPGARQQVDQALQDVISPNCITARTYAFSRDAELFRSGSTTLSRTKSRLSKHESIRVPRSRTSDGLDSMIARGSSSQNPNLATRRNAKKLSISSAPPMIDEKKFLTRTPTSASIPSSPLPSSCPSSVPSLSASQTSNSSSFGSSALPTPPSATPASENLTLKSSLSIVRGVKDLFMHRPGRQYQSSTAHQPPATSPETPAAPQQQSGALHRWTMGSIRRRPRTAPEMRPGEHLSRLSNTFNNTLKAHPNFAAA